MCATLHNLWLREAHVQVLQNLFTNLVLPLMRACHLKIRGRAHQYAPPVVNGMAQWLQVQELCYVRHLDESVRRLSFAKSVTSTKYNSSTHRSPKVLGAHVASPSVARTCTKKVLQIKDLYATPLVRTSVQSFSP